VTEPMDTIGKWTKEMDKLLIKLIESGAKPKDFLIAFPSKSMNALRLRANKLSGLHSVSFSGKAPQAPRASISKPEPDSPVPLKVRECMTCKAKFESTGPGHRLCNDHRRQSNDGDYPVRVR